MKPEHHDTMCVNKIGAHQKQMSFLVCVVICHSCLLIIRFVQNTMQSIWGEWCTEFSLLHASEVHGFIILPMTCVSDRAAQRTNTKTRTNRKRGERHRVCTSAYDSEAPHSLSGPFHARKQYAVCKKKWATVCPLHTVKQTMAAIGITFSLS